VLFHCGTGFVATGEGSWEPRLSRRSSWQNAMEACRSIPLETFTGRQRAAQNDAGTVFQPAPNGEEAWKLGLILVFNGMNGTGLWKTGRSLN
jgi:hypothetical protein